MSAQDRGSFEARDARDAGLPPTLPRRDYQQLATICYQLRDWVVGCALSCAQAKPAQTCCLTQAQQRRTLQTLRPEELRHRKRV